MAGEPLFVGSSRHFDLRLYYVPLWLIRSTNDHRLESFIQFFFLRSSRVSRTTMEESADDSTCKNECHWSRYLVEMNVRPKDKISWKKGQKIH